MLSASPDDGVKLQPTSIVCEFYLGSVVACYRAAAELHGRLRVRGLALRPAPPRFLDLRCQRSEDRHAADSLLFFLLPAIARVR